MQYRAALAVALAPAAAAFTVSVTNKCSYTAYGWNVVDNYGQTGQPTFTLGTGENWSSEFDEKTSGGGPSIKLQKSNSLFENAEQSQVEYKLASGTLFYDLSNINGYPFPDGGITMSTSNSGCPMVNCLAGDGTCSQAYNTPDDLRTLACAGGANINVVICPNGGSSSSSGGGSGSKGGSSSSSSSSSAPVAAPPAPKPTTLQTHAAPAPTPAPAAPAAGNGGNFLEEGSNSGGDGGDVEVVYATKLIAVTSTVVLPGPTPVAEDKREAHLHAHIHRGHSRVMGRHAH